jgi:hypothetical protein
MGTYIVLVLTHIVELDAGIYQLYSLFKVWGKKMLE